MTCRRFRASAPLRSSAQGRPGSGSGSSGAARVRLRRQAAIWQERPCHVNRILGQTQAYAGSAAAPPTAGRRAVLPQRRRTVGHRPPDRLRQRLAVGNRVGSRGGCSSTVTRRPRCCASRQKCDARSISPYHANSGRLARPVGSPANRSYTTETGWISGGCSPSAMAKKESGTASPASRPKWCLPGTGSGCRRRRGGRASSRAHCRSRRAGG